MDEECGCGGHHQRHEDPCGCGMHGHEHRRRFFSKAEKIEKLKNYADELKKELKAVEEKIKEMQA